MPINVDKSDMILNISEDEHGDLYIPDSNIKEVDEDKGVEVVKDKGTSPKDVEIKKGAEGTIMVDESLLEEGEEFGDTGEEDIDEAPVAKPKQTSNKASKSSFDADVYNAFAQELRDEGYLPDVTDEELANIKSTKDLKETLGKQLQMVAGSYREEILQDIVNNLIKEGVIKKSDVVEELQDEKSTIDMFKGDENRMKQYLENYYTRKGLSAKMAKKQIEAAIDLEELVTDALEDDNNYKVERKKQLAENYKKELETKKQRELTFQQELEKNTLERDEFVPGKKVTMPTKKKVLENIPNVISRINSEGTKLLPMLAYLESIGVFDGKWDDILKVGESKATDRLGEILRSPRKVKQSEDMDDKLQKLREAAFSSLPKDYYSR